MSYCSALSKSTTPHIREPSTTREVTLKLNRNCKVNIVQIENQRTEVEFASKSKGYERNFRNCVFVSESCRPNPLNFVLCSVMSSVQTRFSPCGARLARKSAKNPLIQCFSLAIKWIRLTNATITRPKKRGTIQRLTNYFLHHIHSKQHYYCLITSLFSTPHPP